MVYFRPWTVLIDAGKAHEPRIWPGVYHDPRAAARLAAAEFARLELPHLAYLPPAEECEWSDARLDAFRQAVPASALPVAVFPKKRTEKITSDYLHRLREWARYPFDETIEIHVKEAPGTDFALRLCVPAWCAEPAAEVNGAPWTLLFAQAIPAADDNTPDGPVREAALPSGLDPASIAVEWDAFPAVWDWPEDSPLKLRLTDAAGRPLALVPYGCTKLRISAFTVQ